MIGVHGWGLSFNQPRFDNCVSWDQDGLLIATNQTIGDRPKVVFVDRNNTIYLASSTLNEVQIWPENANHSVRSITDNITKPFGLFVTNDGDIYVGNEDSEGSVIKYSMTTNTSSVIMKTNSTCYSFFIDSNDTIYCSMALSHQVIKMSLINPGNNSSLVVVAGNGTNGSLPTMLNTPHGIFVDLNFTLYVADCYNDRIQSFQVNEMNGTTIMGNGSARSLGLRYPAVVFMDDNGYFFVADNRNRRILRVGANDFWCIIGCSISSSGAMFPWSFSFDRNGNLFMIDSDNGLLKNFSLATNSCEISYNRPRLCPIVWWNSNGSTIAGNTTVGNEPQRIFVDKQNFVYATAPSLNTIVILSTGGSTVPRKIIWTNITNLTGIFVTRLGDIYLTSGDANQTWIHKILNDTNVTIPVVLLNDTCGSIFLDFYDKIYCAMPNMHQIIQFSPLENTTNIIAGDGTAGSAPNQLNNPRGIFLTIGLDLYVADCGNNRVQRFLNGQKHGQTILSSNGSLNLSCPNAVTLDGYNNLYVSVWNDNRIIRVISNVVECIAGCTGTNGPGLSELSYPRDLRLDSGGNLYVCDSGNNRIQKFSIMNNICGVSYNRPRLSSCADWNSSANVFMNMTVVGQPPGALFVDRYNNVYIVSSTEKMIRVLYGENSTVRLNLNITTTNVTTVFATSNGDIYYDSNNGSDYYIEKWTKLTGRSTPVLYDTDGICVSMFVDYLNRIYCSLNNTHKIIRQRTHDSTRNSDTIAGNGTSGSTAYQLAYPQGIFVTDRLDLYVADCVNDRIQLFRANEKNALTVSMVPNINLSCPNSVVLDADGNLFISDRNNQRIILISTSRVSVCLLGCPNPISPPGSSLDSPGSLNFDISGNLYILDALNNRILKLYLASNNSCQSGVTNVSLNVVSSTAVAQLISQPISIAQTSVPMTTASFSQLTSSSGSGVNSSIQISWIPCDILQPCYNGATCTNTNHSTLGYHCICSIGFYGPNCQFDQRLCRPNTCRNGGTCQVILNNSFICYCPSSWEGRYCEWKKNYCENVSCFNNGVCRSIWDRYRCECLGDSYSGEHCEKISTRITVYEYMAKSFAFVAITMIATVAVFILTLDILKYCFDMDLTKDDRPMHREKPKTKRRIGYIVHYVYVNDPSIPT